MERAKKKQKNKKGPSWLQRPPPSPLLPPIVIRMYRSPFRLFFPFSNFLINDLNWLTYSSDSVGTPRGKQQKLPLQPGSVQRKRDSGCKTAAFPQNKCDVPGISTKRSCDLQVFTLNGVKHVRRNPCKILSLEILQGFCLLLFV